MAAPSSSPMTDNNAPEYLTVEEVAALLRVSDKTIYRWVQQERSLPVLKLGGSVRENKVRREAPSYLTATGLAMRRFLQ